MNDVRLMNSNGDESLHGTPIPDCIMTERTNQIAKWGLQEHHDFKWHSILNEEVGEVARCINEMNPTNEQSPIRINAAAMQLEHELIQTAAVCVAWLECLRHRRLLTNKQLKQQQTDQAEKPGDNTKDEKK